MPVLSALTTGGRVHYARFTVNENFSLIAMVIFMLLSLAFLAQQIITYR